VLAGSSSCDASRCVYASRPFLSARIDHLSSPSDAPVIMIGSQHAAVGSGPVLLLHGESHSVRLRCGTVRVGEATFQRDDEPSKPTPTGLSIPSLH
jgi:hypothetical protein